MNRKGFEFSFGWIFSIIVGAAILFLAIYASTSFIKTERNIQDTLGSRELEILFNPLETQSFESSVKPRVLEFPENTRLHMRCNNALPLGTHSITLSTESGIGKKWQESGTANTVANKYIFSDVYVEGKEVNVFVKPFNLPYKVSDSILLWTNNYCFVNAPSEVKTEINSLGLNESGWDLALTSAGCKEGSVKVCFNGGGECDVNVDASSHRVSKNGTSVAYTDDLLYAAIISDPSLYSCEVNRLLLRTSSLAELYKGKSQLISAKENGCSSDLQIQLNQLESTTLLPRNSTSNDVYTSLIRSQIIANDLEIAHNSLTCKLWGSG